jgi:hypothetical protein
MGFSHRYRDNGNASAILPRAGVRSLLVFPEFDVALVLATDVLEGQHGRAGTAATRDP